MKNRKLKKLLVFAALSGLVLGGGTAFAEVDSDNTYLNTNSFMTLQGDAGLARLDAHSSLAWSGGIGYQWVIADDFTVGFEGNYLQNGKITQGNGISAESALIAPMVVADYYLTPSFNLIMKGGYGYEMNQYQGMGISIHDNSWQPVASIGVGYLIPVSDVAYLNWITDVTWVNQNTSQSNQVLSDSGRVLQNIQYKTGIQLMF